MSALREQVTNFLKSQPMMTLRPTRSKAKIIEGSFEFTVVNEQEEKTEDRYNLQILIPQSFPNDLPEIYELGSRITRSPDNHINPNGSFCLGSPLRLKLLLSKVKTLEGFAKDCITPFLYAHSTGGFLFGELSHGRVGLIEDYKDIFEVQTENAVISCLELTSLKLRIANKRKCPCSCGRRLGVCRLRTRISELRKIAPRSWFAKHRLYLERQG